MREWPELTAAILCGVLIALLVARHLAARRMERRLRRDLAQLREQLQQHDRLANVGQMVSGLAQELKGPLQGLLGAAEVMAASEPSDASAQEVQDIRENATRAAGIVRNLLAFTETNVLDRRWHDLNDIVRRALNGRRSDLAAAGVGVRFERAERLPLVYVDGRQLEKVLATLLDRSARIGVPLSTLDLTVVTRHGIPAADRIVVEIDDPALVPTADETSWSGDIDSCRRVIEAHGGSLEVEARSTGGFRFILELPVGADSSFQLEPGA
jgi:two-component system, NtrC family, sensor kinase